jgi:type I restriction enzyme R subunit
MNEAETRKELIDSKLRRAGWDVNNLAQVSQEFDIPMSLPEGVCESRTPYEGHQYCIRTASAVYFLLKRDR